MNNENIRPRVNHMMIMGGPSAGKSRLIADLLGNLPAGHSATVDSAAEGELEGNNDVVEEAKNGCIL